MTADVSRETRPPYFADGGVTLYHGNALEVLAELPAGAADCCLTSPPYYGLRNYRLEPAPWPAVEFVPMTGLPPVAVPAMTCCLGLEPDPWAYVGHMVLIVRQLRRVLVDHGTFWLNLGDSYAGKANGGAAFDRHRGHGHRSKQGIIPPRQNNTAAAPYKSLLGIPWRVAFALQADGWTIRNDIIWHKPNAMPESVADRLANRYEHLFLLSKGADYRFDLAPVKVPSTGRASGATAETLSAYADGTAIERQARKLSGGNPGSTLTEVHDTRNPGDVWSIATSPFGAAHFATMSPRLAARAILAAGAPGGTVVDPFSGAGTTGQAAALHGMTYIGIDASTKYLDLALRTRLAQPGLDFADTAP